MAIAAVKKFQIAGLKKEIDLISREIIKNDNIELIERESSIKNFKSYLRDNPYSDLLNEIKEILDILKINSSNSGVGFADFKNLNLENIKKYINPLRKRINRLERLEKKFDQEEDRLKNLKHHVYLMRNMDIDLGELKELSYISLIFGSINKEGYHRLIENINDLPILVLEVNRDDEKVWFFTFTKKEHHEKALNILKSAYFEQIKLPPRVKGQPRYILKRIEHRLGRITILREQIALEYKKMNHRSSEQLITYLARLKFYNKIKDIANQYYSESEHIFILTGWISAYRENDFAEEIKSKYKDVLYFSKDISPKSEEKPPTIMKNPAWVKPFESLVKLYGVPAYNEKDPSLFLAITYILMFGMMFGDLGQGFVFTFLGWLIYSGRLSISSRDNSYLFISLGISSMFFGLLYGSIFGMEDIIPALLIRPMDNIMTWLGITVILGIILLIISMLFNLSNSYQRKDLAEGVFSRNGFSGLFFYLFALASLASLLMRGKLIFSPLFTLVLLIVPLLMIFFKAPLASMVKGEGWVIPGKTLEYFLESSFELFDTLLAYMSNTISFVRIGAFTLNHVGLSMAVIILSEMMSKNISSLLILIVGNLVIMGLEGLVVGIQILRLEFFELFGKFYRGDGKEFAPVRIND
ncbi:hypothetical protein GM661_09005 [Iocasia frigidifontis]|uniref:V-type proton ATPase subunit a n=2 Tax=Halanaerobiaceae TaxID=972 RepID=A0A8A7KIY7_9FIRM|nr:V-type ATPase 116kDa subunit family protein [Iocasia fonsfrigidae]QTL98104.1 hypothetical protein GM661_09005 [Iocasia fonsfrigidae]